MERKRIFTKIREIVVISLNLIAAILSILLLYSFLSILFLFFDLIDLIKLPYTLFTFIDPPITIIDIFIRIILIFITITLIKLFSYLFVEESFDQLGGTIIISSEAVICSNCGGRISSDITIGDFCQICKIEFKEEKIISKENIL